METVDDSSTQFGLAEVHEAIAASRPDQECLVFRDRRLTWADVTDRTRRLANYLIPKASAATPNALISPVTNPDRIISRSICITATNISKPCWGRSKRE
jgi:acyl-CoA synthetase (AMP-forming)/AMP-acid ligase II